MNFNIPGPPGRATIYTNQTEANIHEHVTFQCTIDNANKGNPDFYHYTLFMNSHCLNESHSGFFTIGITRVTQEGDYQCQAANSNGDGDISYPVFLHVYGRLFKDLEHSLEKVFWQ